MTPVHNSKSQKHCQKVGEWHCCLQGMYCLDVKAIRDRHRKQEEVLPLSPGAPCSCAMRSPSQRQGVLKRWDFFRNTETKWCHEPVPKWIEQCQASTALPGHSLPIPSLATANPKNSAENPKFGQSRVGRARWPQDRGRPSLSSCCPTHGHSFIIPVLQRGFSHFHDNRGSVVSPQFEPSAPLWQEQSPG